MARTNNLSNFLTDVASAIKEKTGNSSPIPASEFDIEISNIETVGNYQTKTLNVGSNGTQIVTPDTGYDAIEQLTLNVSVPMSSLQSKSYEFTSNQTMTLLPDTGYDGFSSVSVTVDVTDPEYATNLTLSQQILGSPLPYIPLEYIESTGTQYINTGLVPTNGYTINTELAFKDFSQLNVITGTYGHNQSAGQGDYRHFLRTDPTTGQMNYQYGSSSKYGLTTMELNKVYDIECRLMENEQFLKIDNNLIVSTNVSSQQPSASTLLFLACYNFTDDAADNIMSAKIYSCKYYYDANYNIVRDFVPVKRRSDNEIGLYDKVTNTFFTNQGTGSFIAGPEVN